MRPIYNTSKCKRRGIPGTFSLNGSQCEEASVAKNCSIVVLTDGCPFGSLLSVLHFGPILLKLVFQFGLYVFVLNNGPSLDICSRCSMSRNVLFVD